MQGQSWSSRAVRIIEAPSSRVVFVQGIRNEAEREPSRRVTKETLDNIISKNRKKWEWKTYGTEQSTCRLGSKDDMELTVVSPRRRQPKKVTNATAQIAAWKEQDSVMALNNVKRCSIETGAQSGCLCRDPSL